MTVSQKTKVLIIGSGPAGYTAALYAARAGLNPLQALGLQPGGQLTITTDVENYPGFAQGIQGPWLMEQMHQQAQHVGTEMIEDHIEKVNFSKRPFQCWTEGGNLIEAETVIIATGAQARWLGLACEEKYRGYGVSGCATCDGFFYKGKKVMVVGGGNTAVEEAIYLTNFASEVILVHRRDRLRAEKVAQERLFNNPKVRVIWNSIIHEIMGTESPKSVNKVLLKHITTNEMQTVDTDGVFIAIGHTPMSDIFKGQIDLDPDGYILVQKGATGTNIRGVFAAGDVQDKIFRQAVTAAGQGCMAALEVERFLHSHEFQT